MVNTQLNLKTKKVTQHAKIIRELKRRGILGLTSRDMINMEIFKYSSRIAELRKEGHKIIATHVKGSLWKYNLKED